MVAQPLEGTHVIGAFLSLTVFGLYTCLFVQALYHLHRAPVHSVLFFVTLSVLWLMILTIIALKASNAYQMVIPLDPSHPHQQLSNVFRSTAAIILTPISGMICNSFFCWRLYVMWKRNWKVLIAPGAILLALVACHTMIATYAVKSQNAPQYGSLKNTWQMTFVSLGLTVNVLVISLMCFKIWRSSRIDTRINAISEPFYHHILHVLVESGALYAVVVFISLVARGAQMTKTSIIVIYIIPNVIGISPTLLVLRIATSARMSEGAKGHYTAPPTSQRWSISRPVFARMAADSAATTTQMSEIRYASPTGSDKICQEPPGQSDISSGGYGSTLYSGTPKLV